MLFTKIALYTIQDCVEIVDLFYETGHLLKNVHVSQSYKNNLQ